MILFIAQGKAKKQGEAKEAIARGLSDFIWEEDFDEFTSDEEEHFYEFTSDKEEPVEFTSDEEEPVAFTSDEEEPVEFKRDEEEPVEFTSDEEEPDEFTSDDEKPDEFTSEEEPDEFTSDEEEHSDEFTSDLQEDIYTPYSISVTILSCDEYLTNPMIRHIIQAAQDYLRTNFSHVSASQANAVIRNILKSSVRRGSVMFVRGGHVVCVHILGQRGWAFLHSSLIPSIYSTKVKEYVAKTIARILIYNLEKVQLLRLSRESSYPRTCRLKSLCKERAATSRWIKMLTDNWTWRVPGEQRNTGRDGVVFQDV